jgi:LysR family glycine cleavage system transcriptional activator
MHRPMDWSRWLGAAGVADLDSPGGIRFDNAALAYQGAIDELGVAIAIHALVEDDLRSGRLIAPFELQVATQGAYYLASPEEGLKAERVVAFEEWLLGEALQYERSASTGQWVQEDGASTRA